MIFVKQISVSIWCASTSPAKTFPFPIAPFGAGRESISKLRFSMAWALSACFHIPEREEIEVLK